MQEIFNFVKNNWQLIVGVLTFIASVIVAAIRKKPVSCIVTYLYNWCLYAVKMAEKTDYKGSDKLNFAIGLVFHCIEENFPNVKASNYQYAITKIIENILTTPQKKER